jgi:putative transposase
MPVRPATIMDIRETIAKMAVGGVSITEIAEMFEISRPTVYKYRDRYLLGGREGLTDRPRTPKSGWRTPGWMVERVLKERRLHEWGSKKIRRRLLDAEPEVAWPARSTMDALFKAHGLVKPRQRRVRVHSPFRRRYEPTEPGELTTIDFKGQFRMKNARWCHPLTVADAVSRYLLACRALESIEFDGMWRAFERVLRDHGLPAAVLSDNGPPFGGHGLSRFSTFSVRLMKLGIAPVFIDPGVPQQNGVHERMHRTLNQEIRRRVGADLSSQQRLFNSFRRVFNHERPHEAIDLARPAQRYSGSPRPFPSRPPGPPHYPTTFQVRRVSGSGAIKWNDQSIFISHTLAGEPLGFELTDTAMWTVHFGAFVIGHFDERERRFL